VKRRSKERRIFTLRAKKLREAFGGASKSIKKPVIALLDGKRD
jgi:hypothetical protein